MARVHAAEDRRTGRQVAVKIVTLDDPKGTSPHDLFLAEAATTERIRHPNVVRVFDIGELDDGRPYLVMELLHGESLGDRLRTRESIPATEALRIGRDAARGLGAAHALHVVHRDVKPDNVFLDRDPEGRETVKIVDFGLARHGKGSGFRSLGLTVGTLAYMAPEQAVGDPIDERTDIYALGVVLFRALAGVVPFASRDVGELLAQQVALPAPPPSVLHASLDERVDRVILRALRKDPAHRYPTMAAFEAELDRLLGERGGALEIHVAGTDVYVPRTSESRTAATFFYRKLGLPVPVDLQA